MIIFNKLDNYFVVSADSQTFLGFEMTANFRDTSPLSVLLLLCEVVLTKLHLKENVMLCFKPGE